MSGAPRTIVEKIWADHVVGQDEGAPAVLAVDLHLIHEVTSPQAFTGLRQRGLRVRRPDQTVATADHSIPTTPRNLPMLNEHEHEHEHERGAELPARTEVRPVSVTIDGSTRVVEEASISGTAIARFSLWADSDWSTSTPRSRCCCRSSWPR